MSDFLKALKVFAMQHGWLVEQIIDGDVVTIRIYKKENGQIERIASIVIDSDNRLVPEITDGIKASIKKRIEKEVTGAASDSLMSALNELYDWLLEFFT